MMFPDRVEAVKLRVIEVTNGYVFTLGTPDGGSLTHFVSRDELLAVINIQRKLTERFERFERFELVVEVTDSKRARAPIEDAEQALGRAIGALFPPLWAMLLGNAIQSARGQCPLILAVEADAAEVRRLPWELLAYNHEGVWMSALSTNDLIVVRLNYCARWPARALGSHLGVVIHTPTPDDPDIQPACRELTKTLRDSRVPVVELHDELSPAAEHGGEELLCLFAHGLVVEGERLLIRASGRNAGLTAISTALGERIRGSFAVVLLVCSGGAATVDDNLAMHLLRVGAPAVFAPQAPISDKHAKTFITALVKSLSEGDTLLTGLKSARQDVAKLKDASLSDRHWLMSLCVGAVSAPSRRLLPVVIPPQVRQVGPHLQSFLIEVLELIHDEPELGGFLGVEALLIGLATLGTYRRDSLLLTELAKIGHRHQKTLMARLGLLRSNVHRSVAESPEQVSYRAAPLTPRVQGALRVLPADAGVTELWVELLKARFLVLGDLRALCSACTLPTAAVGHDSEPRARQDHDGKTPSWVEVIGGPEDGHTFEYPVVSMPIVRASSNPPSGSTQLYVGTPVTDAGLSTQYQARDERYPSLILEPGGKSRWMGPKGETKRPSGVPKKLTAGDVIKLGKATWLGFY